METEPVWKDDGTGEDTRMHTVDMIFVLGAYLYSGFDVILHVNNLLRGGRTVSIRSKILGAPLLCMCEILLVHVPPLCLQPALRMNEPRL